MAILNWMKARTALLLGGSSTEYPTYMMLGSGSGTVAVTQTTLFNPFDRQAVTSTDPSTTSKILWTADWNSVEMSGLTLSEFGMCGSAAGTTGSMWSKVVIPNIVFDGTNELRIEQNVEVF